MSDWEEFYRTYAVFRIFINRLMESMLMKRDSNIKIGELVNQEREMKVQHD